MRDVGATGIGALKGATVVVVADEVEVVVAGIELCPSSCAGVAFLLFELEESRGGPRPKDRPTADAPTTVAVAQSCVTRMHQSLPSVRLEGLGISGQIRQAAVFGRSRGISKQVRASIESTCRHADL